MLTSLAAAVAAIILAATATIFLCAALYLFLVSLPAAPSGAALLAGLAVGGSPELRNAIEKMLKN